MYTFYVYVWLPRYIDYDRKKGIENFYRNWLCQTVLFGLYVKSLCQGIYHILFDNMDSWHIVPYVCIACVFVCVCLCA